MTSTILRWVRGTFGCLAGLLSLAVVLSGCTAKHYRKSADKEVYQILRDVDNHVFGRTNEFSIDTRYSRREPATIPPSEIIAERSATDCRVVTLEQALELAVANSREYQTEKERLYLTALSLTGARYEFGPQFFADSTAQAEGSPSGTQLGSLRSKVGVSQLLRTGGRLTLALGNDLIRYFSGKPDDQARDSAINALSVDLTQPLLRGFGINNPLVEGLTQAERDVVYAVRSFSRYQQQFAVETVTAYFELLTLKDIVRNNYRNFTNRVETTKYLEARAVDRERLSSADDARTAELVAKRAYLDSLALYLNTLDTFKLRLGLPLSESLYPRDQDLEELIQAGLTPVEINRNAAFDICVKQQMDVLNAIDQFEDAKRKVRVAADLLRPQLDFFATAKLESESPDDYTRFDPDKVRYTTGLRLNLPVDRLRERNNYRATLVAFESQLRALSLALDRYRDRIERGLRTLELDRLNHLNSVESLRVARRRVENNVMLMEAGRATIRDVREAQDGLIQAQNELATSYTDYLSARLALLLNMGVIDTRPRKFWLTDPLANRLTPAQRGAPTLRMPNDQVLPPDRFTEPSS